MEKAHFSNQSDVYGLRLSSVFTEITQQAFRSGNTTFEPVSDHSLTIRGHPTFLPLGSTFRFTTQSKVSTFPSSILIALPSSLMITVIPGGRGLSSISATGSIEDNQQSLDQIRESLISKYGPPDLVDDSNALDLIWFGKQEPNSTQPVSHLSSPEYLSLKSALAEYWNGTSLRHPRADHLIAVSNSGEWGKFGTVLFVSVKFPSSTTKQLKMPRFAVVLIDFKGTEDAAKGLIGLLEKAIGRNT